MSTAALQSTELIWLERCAEAHRLRTSLKSFVRAAWHVVEPDIEMQWGWHLDVLCRELERARREPGYQAVYNIPPGTMKSLLVSVLFPAWVWVSEPSAKFLCASYGMHLSTRDNLRFRDVVTSSWYRGLFGDVRLREDQRAKGRLYNTLGGWRVATSTGGVGTGEHPDYKIIDDPLTAEQARSAAEREAVNLWVDRTMSSRGISRGARTILIMQRLHEKDTTAHLLAQGGWEHVMLPMRYERKRSDPRDPRLAEGSLLWPGLFDEDKVQKLEIALGAYGRAGQLQQRPAPEGGGMFQRAWLRVVPRDAVPKMRRRVRAWDVAGTEGGGGARTAGVRIGDAGPEARPRFFVEHVVKGRWSAGKVDEIVRQTTEVDGRGVSVREEQEGGSAGKAVIAKRQRDLAGYDYRGVSPSGDKEVRATPLAAQCEAGNVALVSGEWVQEFLDEFELFPNGETKDQVDAAAHAFNELTAKPAPGKKRDVAWG